MKTVLCKLRMILLPPWDEIFQVVNSRYLFSFLFDIIEDFPLSLGGNGILFCPDGLRRKGMASKTLVEFFLFSQA